MNVKWVNPDNSEFKNRVFDYSSIPFYFAVSLFAN